MRVWSPATSVARDCAGTCIVNGSAAAPWDNPTATDTTAGRVVGLKTWNATVAPLRPVLCGNTHCGAGAGLPRVRERPPSPGFPTDCNSEATTVPDSAVTSVATAVSSGA